MKGLVENNSKLAAAPKITKTLKTEQGNKPKPGNHRRLVNFKNNSTECVKKVRNTASVGSG